MYNYCSRKHRPSVRIVTVNERNSRVAAAVAAAGIEPAIKILDADAKTAAAAAAQLGCEVGAIANSLVFECDGEPLLVMASGAARVNTDVLAQHLGAHTIAKADAKLVRSATGQVIGGVAPTGHPAPLRTVVDETLASYPLIWTAAGTADSVMPLTYDQLLSLTGGKAVAVR
ncbi:aminoacyl-tRNA deacylase [Mycolicibacterium wolinskyi]|uniref:Aminoacyl-tRNA deacylase n=1 Tax=Mycolicibacterium wolinskyi TaxID=59750 RepID=A0A1X2F9R7_9MYCO|nr:aminoacyl-tRNA deacylase [Mycolicibacterium wolinskyi]